MLVATFSVPPEAFALERTVTAVPELSLEVEQVAARGPDWVMSCVWIATGSGDELIAALERDPTVAQVVETEQFPEALFCHLEWSDAVKARIRDMVDHEGSILAATVTEGRWRIRVRFVSRDQLEAFREHFAEREVSFRLHDLAEPETAHHTFGTLTTSQHEALLTAAERGYYRVPREVSTAELGEELGISHQAVSELLRRGTENLIAATLPE
ncbi:helix-turn-helix domain-containing protein [Natronococcus sp. A-GB1]|uniref:helix-turn-helix domain-containing protein n=1 Tax=Natronococcus sp. A-GB1 TaxID=3037648 RepID=UPI00241D0FF2|nr:helix-turn-helix domain-containing protein [Natronococcus sp. A-GB1]MDG5760344.1 helix-turn-helix domain-containing protein [Natronococcus sp. A-GB1]